MKQTRDVIAYFIILLVISMPFISSSAMAQTITITGNTGEAGIPEFIDAQGDTWTVDVEIANVAAIEAENIQIKIGQLEEPFKSCEGELGKLKCSYLSALTDGVAENEYEFQVEYKTIDEFNNPILVQSQPAVVRADGSAPAIHMNQLPKQLSEGPIFMDFVVSDKVSEGAPAVGIKTISIIDSDTGDIIQTLDAQGKEQYDFIVDGATEGKLSAQFPGEGLKKLRLEAEDLFGHKSTLTSLSLEYDFIKPVLVGGTNFTDLGKFIGSIEQESGLTIDIKETNDLVEVRASSSETNLDRQGADSCERLDAETWRCTWNSVIVKPEASVNVLFEITDEYGNQISQTLSQQLVPDSVAPVLTYFGTDSTFLDVNYVKQGKNTITVTVQEQGSGMDETGLRLNLKAFGRGSHVAPDECFTEEKTFVCTWDVNVNVGAGVARVGLSEFQDLVGNKGLQVEKEFVVDTGAPSITSVELSGQDEVGKRNFMHSGDVIVFDVEVKEETGLTFLVDMRDLSNDPAVDYPEGPLNEAGFLIATEEKCTRDEETWVCSFESKPVKSGPINSAYLVLKVQDTAGNEAKTYPTAKNAQKNAGKSGKYTFSLLGLDNEENPDFWGVSKVKLLTDFIDLDTTELIPARMPVEITLSSNHSLAKVLKIDLVGCAVAEGQEGTSVIGSKVESKGEVIGAQVEEGEAPPEPTAPSEPEVSIPTIKKAISYGGTTAGGEVIAKPTILLEFDQFNGKDVFGLSEDVDTFEEYEAEYDCQLKILSQIGKNAIKNAEIQDVTIPVIFAFSELGAIDENLEDKISDITNDWKFEFANAISYFTEIINWIRYFVNMLEGVIIIFNIYNLVMGKSDTLKAIPATQPLAAAICGSGSAGSLSSQGAVGIMQTVMAVFTCNSNPEAIAGTWYGQWQNSVLKGYNTYTGRTALKQPAGSLYENAILSMVGLCVPGMLHNLEKYRQVRCREIICYKNEVPQGLATVESCAALGEYLTCRYYWGPWIDMLGFLDVWDNIVTFIKSFFTSIFGYIDIALQIPCAISCGASGTAASVCHWFEGGRQILKLLNLVLGAIDSWPGEVGNQFCGQLEDVEGVFTGY